jgi:hypothetical protein
MSSDCSEIREHMCNFTISFIKNNLVGGQSWMVSLSIPLVLRRFLGWKELLRSEVLEVVRTLDGDLFLRLVGRLLKTISWMFSRSFIFERSLERASMQPLFPLSPRKP